MQHYSIHRNQKYQTKKLYMYSVHYFLSRASILYEDSAMDHMIKLLSHYADDYLNFWIKKILRSLKSLLEKLFIALW